MSDMTSTGIATPGKCEWCGMIHGAKCPLVKAIEYEHGMVKRVEFFAPNDYMQPLNPGGWPPAWPYKPLEVRGILGGGPAVSETVAVAAARSCH